jgi:hypothetical protein
VSRVSRVCPGSPRCLFTGSFCTSTTYCTVSFFNSLMPRNRKSLRFSGSFLAHDHLGRVMLSGRVCEWVARKNDHANDPFANLGELPSPAAQGIGAATASAAGTIVAKSDRIQKANNRVYIPVQDCNASLFILSEKRWR